MMRLIYLLQYNNVIIPRYKEVSLAIAVNNCLCDPPCICTLSCHWTQPCKA